MPSFGNGVTPWNDPRPASRKHLEEFVACGRTLRRAASDVNPPVDDVRFVHSFGDRDDDHLLVAFDFVIFVPPALACIWFGKEIGRYIGLAAFRPITKETPGPFVVLGGWLLLLWPAIMEILKIIK